MITLRVQHGLQIQYNLILNTNYDAGILFSIFDISNTDIVDKYIYNYSNIFYILMPILNIINTYITNYSLYPISNANIFYVPMLRYAYSPQYTKFVLVLAVNHIC